MRCVMIADYCGWEAADNTQMAYRQVRNPRLGFHYRASASDAIFSQ